MHRNIPNYIHHPMSAMFLLICTSHFHPLTLQLAHPIEAIVSTGKAVVAEEERTWIPSSTVCAPVIAWNGLDQLLKDSLIARLVTLAQCGGHIVVMCVVDFE